MYVFSYLNAVCQSLKYLCSVSGCLAGVFFWEREHRGGVMKSCFSVLGEFMFVPQLCHCYNVPTAVLTQQPFAELTALPSLIRVWEIFLSCDKKAYLWFAGQSLGTVAMTLCCKDKNDATLSSPAKTPNFKIKCIKCASAKLPFSEGMAITTTDRLFREEATTTTTKSFLESLLCPANSFLKLQNWNLTLERKTPMFFSGVTWPITSWSTTALSLLEVMALVNTHL